MPLALGRTRYGSNSLGRAMGPEGGLHGCLRMEKRLGNNVWRLPCLNAT